MAAALSAYMRRRPAPARAGIDPPVTVQLALLVVEIADLRAQVAALAALHRVEKAIYYTTAGGRKLHTAEDCRTLTKSTEVKILLLDADAVDWLDNVGAVCSWCDAPTHTQESK